MSEAQNGEQGTNGNAPANNNPVNEDQATMGSSLNTAAAAQPEVPVPPPPPPHTHVPPPPSTLLIECLCSDGVVVKVPANYLRVSRLFNDMCRNLQLDDENAVGGGTPFEGHFPVGPIRGEVMQKIADWCEKHCGE